MSPVINVLQLLYLLLDCTLAAHLLTSLRKPPPPPSSAIERLCEAENIRVRIYPLPWDLVATAFNANLTGLSSVGEFLTTERAFGLPLPLQPFSSATAAGAPRSVLKAAKDGELVTLSAPVELGKSAALLSLQPNESSASLVLRDTRQFSLGRIFHRRLMELPPKCVADTPENGTLFFIPYYRGRCDG